MRVLISACPLYGHVNTLLPLARAAQRAGHEVRFATGPDLAGQIAVFDETIKSAEDRVRRTELRSPVYGIINRINVTTVGAVVQPVPCQASAG